jgi:hypothetical protein
MAEEAKWLARYQHCHCHGHEERMARSLIPRERWLKHPTWRNNRRKSKTSPHLADDTHVQHGSITLAVKTSMVV